MSLEIDDSAIERLMLGTYITTKNLISGTYTVRCWSNSTNGIGVEITGKQRGHDHTNGSQILHKVAATPISIYDGQNGG